MKKWLSVLFSLVLVYCLAACGGGKDTNESAANDTDADKKETTTLSCWCIPMYRMRKF